MLYYILKLEKPRCIIDSRKFFFSHRVKVGRWNSLNQEMIDTPSVNDVVTLITNSTHGA